MNTRNRRIPISASIACLVLWQRRYSRGGIPPSRRVTRDTNIGTLQEGLRLPHIAPIIALVDELRDEGGRGWVPYVARA
jgi:hypothetical protein